MTDPLGSLDIGEIEKAISDVRGSLESEDAAEINAKAEALQAAFHSVSEQMYAAAAQQAQAAGAADGAGNSAAAADADGTADEEVVDAEVVDDKEG